MFNSADHQRVIEVSRRRGIGYDEDALFARCLLALDAEFVELRDQEARNVQAMMDVTELVQRLSAELARLCHTMLAGSAKPL